MATKIQKIRAINLAETDRWLGIALDEPYLAYGPLSAPSLPFVPREKTPNFDMPFSLAFTYNWSPPVAIH
jgi:hypothetical protein